MKNRFVYAFVAILIVIGIIVTCCNLATTSQTSTEKEGEIAVSSVTPEATVEPTATPDATTQPTSTPEVAIQPTATPEATTQPTSTPEATTQPTSTPEVTTQPTATPEATTQPTATPEVTTQPTSTPEATIQPTATPEATMQPTFERRYVSEKGFMPYVLYTPSTINENEKTPLIVWLHGSGEVGVEKETFFNSGLLRVMNKWRRQVFNAYVICPQLDSYTGRWNKESAKDNLQALLDKFIEEHNIDLERIIIVGHSLGGQGALYMAHELPEYFSRCVVLSGYNPGIDIAEIKIPTLGFVGLESAGEDAGSESYMRKYFMDVFGDENTFFFETSHGGIPNAVFNFDTDDDDKSDLIEWMLGEFEF